MYVLILKLIDPLTVLVLFSMLALVNLWRKRAKGQTRSLILLTIPLVLLSLCCTPVVSHWAASMLERQFPPLTERPEQIDGIVVLSGGIHPADSLVPRTHLAADSMRRCVYAADLYHEGPPCPLILCGGKVDPNRSGPTLAAAMRDFLIQQGVAPEDLILENESRDTYQNAAFAAKLLEKHNIDKFVLVTDAYHLYRAQQCFRRLGLHPIPAGAHYETRSSEWGIYSFVPSTSGAQTINAVFHELVGRLWYKLLGRM